MSYDLALAIVEAAKTMQRRAMVANIRLQGYRQYDDSIGDVVDYDPEDLEVNFFETHGEGVHYGTRRVTIKHKSFQFHCMNREEFRSKLSAILSTISHANGWADRDVSVTLSHGEGSADYGNGQDWQWGDGHQSEEGKAKILEALKLVTEGILY